MSWSFTRKIGAALLGALAALAVVASAQAGGWSVAVLDAQSAAAVGGVVQPGVPVEIGFTVVQHGIRPLSDLTPQITLTREAGGAPLTVSAVAHGEPGHYLATVTLPDPGVWRWEINAFGPPSVMAPITVAAAPARGPAIPIPALVVTTLAAVAIGLLGLRIWSGRRSAAVPQ
ncbi:MAG: hypothetical protein HGA45_41055 [Chloroflexales bacterium]|nr:hypothetical protein [Chloroflexales bacterium]